LVVVSVTLPNVPALVPPARLKLKALLLRPLMAFPAASMTTRVTVSPLPEVAGDEAKVTVDLTLLTGPVTTCTVGLAFRTTPLMVLVSVLADPTVLLAVKVAV
jgi:hypothetical protein